MVGATAGHAWRRRARVTAATAMLGLAALPIAAAGGTLAPGRQAGVPPIVLVADDAATAGWDSYTNGRYKCTARYPPTTFTKPQPEPDNGDGRTIQADDGAALRIYGANNLNAQSIAELEKAGRDSPGANVVYRAANATFFVLSGFRGENIYYTRSTLSADKQTICSFDLEYPKTAKATYDPLTGTIGSTLQAP